MEEQLPKDIPWYRWFIALTADGIYRFVPAHKLKTAEAFIGKHGGGIYTHAGYLIFAADNKWMAWLSRGYPEKCAEARSAGLFDPPHINVLEIDCSFAPDVLQWLQKNEAALQEVGGKYYDNLPRH